MELTQEMLGLERLRIMRREMRNQTRFGRRQVKNNCGCIRRIHAHRLTRHGDIVFRRFKNVFIQHQIIVIKNDIFAGEWRAIRPLMAFAQLDCQLGKIIIPLERFRHIWNDGLKIIRIPQKADVTHRQKVRRSRFGRIRQNIQLPAIAAHSVIRDHHQRL